MKRPPFNRFRGKYRTKNRSNNQNPPSGASSDSKRGFNRGFQRGLRNIVILAVIASLYQWQATGEVTWPKAVLEQITSVLSGNNTGLAKARDVLEEQGAEREGQPKPKITLQGRVVRVADGDTLSILEDNGEQHKVRLFAIDSPELKQTYGPQARDLLADLVYQKQVGLNVVEIDQYDRMVAVVYLDGKDINRALVASGAAWWYRYHGPHERALEHAEEQAREQHLGLWGVTDSPQAPWDWRREQRR